MVTEYSLLTCLGRDGRTVTLTIASPCVVTLSAHGMPDGHPIRFTTTGTLPTGLAINTTYYVKSPTANVFNVSATNGGAAINTSGSQSGTHKAIGEYWATLPATDPGNGGNYRARYGAAGSERVYASMGAVATTINAAVSNYFLTQYIEIQGKWTDNSTADFSGKWKSIVIASRINGSRSSAFHGGIRSAGYVLTTSAQYSIVLMMRNYNSLVDGLEVVNSHATTAADNSAIRLVGVNSRITNNIVRAAYGIHATALGVFAFNNIAIDCKVRGFYLYEAYGSDPAMYFGNLAVACGVGFSGVYAGSSCVGNIAIANATNWGTVPTQSYLSHNIGESGDTVWGINALTTGSTSMFMDYVNGDFRPASASAPQVELIALTDGDGLHRYDIADAVRPSYINAITDKADAGPFEFDHGNGLAPLQVQISITGMISGSVLAIYNANDMSVIAAPATTSGSYSASYTYTGDTNIIVRVRKGTSGGKYLPYEYTGTITSAGFNLNVSQILDPIA